jgi:peptidoglycan/xylan/chitin deacetylase (PgdA/CDA1 family)
MRGEVYCSTRCARDAARHPLWSRLRDPLARPVSAWVAVVAVALALAGPLVLALRTVGELDRLHAPGPFPTLRRRDEGARIEDVVETPDGVRLTGRTDGGSAVFLYADGRLVASAFAEGGRFRFDGVRESGPYRVRSMPSGAPRSQGSEAAPRVAESLSRPAMLPTRAAAPSALPTPASAPAPPAMAAAPEAARPAAPPPRAATRAEERAAAARPTPAPRRAAPSPTPEVRLAIRFSRPTEAPAPPKPRPASIASAPVAAAPLPPPVASAPAPAPPAAAGLLAPDLTRGPADRREVLVSFDAGSSDRGAAQILDALARRGIHTTIFLTGEFIRRYPELTRRIAADGHEVGNHTDTHPHLTTFAADGRQATRRGVDRAFLTGELARTARLYREATGRAMAPLWRAPFGEHNPEIRRWAAEQGYWHVGWTGGRGGLDGLDWISDPSARGYQSADGLLRRLVRRAENGGIVLLHLGSDRPEPVAERIDLLLDGLRERKFEFARASDFLARQGWDSERLASFRQASAAR